MSHGTSLIRDGSDKGEAFLRIFFLKCKNVQTVFVDVLNVVSTALPRVIEMEFETEMRVVLS